jgi:hypothetical protein
MELEVTVMFWRTLSGQLRIKGASNCLEIKLVLAGCEHSRAARLGHA